MKFVYFGSSKVSIYVLEELEKAGFIPALIVSTPDKPQGRGMKLTPNIVKEYAIRKNIRVISPEKLDASFEAELKKETCDLFIVASYKKIIPKSIVEMPKYKTLNVHPSLLPKYRGAAPLPSAMLDDTKDTGVTIMRLNDKMDEGPIVAQKPIHVTEWPAYEIFEEMMAREGGRLLASILNDWTTGKINEVEQNHSQATYTRKITKEDGLIDLAADPYTNFRKIQTYHEWPQAYFFVEKVQGTKDKERDENKKIRVKITQASFKNGKLMIEKVIPEGKKEMSYKDFSSGYSVI